MFTFSKVYYADFGGPFIQNHYLFNLNPYFLNKSISKPLIYKYAVFIEVG